MKTSFLPRPCRVIRPAPESAREFTVSESTAAKFSPIWNTEPAQPQTRFVPHYDTFPQAPDPNNMLSADLEPFRRTK